MSNRGGCTSNVLFIDEMLDCCFFSVLLLRHNFDMRYEFWCFFLRLVQVIVIQPYSVYIIKFNYSIQGQIFADKKTVCINTMFDIALWACNVKSVLFRSPWKYYFYKCGTMWHTLWHLSTVISCDSMSSSRICFSEWHNKSRMFRRTALMYVFSVSLGFHVANVRLLEIIKRFRGETEKNILQKHQPPTIYL